MTEYNTPEFCDTCPLRGQIAPNTVCAAMALVAVRNMLLQAESPDVTTAYRRVPSASIAEGFAGVFVDLAIRCAEAVQRGEPPLQEP